MSKTQHTPGPWNFGPDPLITNGKPEMEGIFIIGDNGREFVARIEPISDLNGEGGTSDHLQEFAREREQANARLIAAAPETAAERDRLKEELETVKSLFEAQGGIVIILENKLKTKENKIMEYSHRITDLSYLNSELLKALKEMNRWVVTNYPEHGNETEYGLCSTFNKARTAIHNAEYGKQ